MRLNQLTLARTCAPIAVALLATFGVSAEDVTDKLMFKEVDGGYSVRAPKESTELVGVIDIPETYNGKNVVALGDSAFYGCGLITAINLPKTIASIPLRAFFKTTSLEAINVNPDNKAFVSTDGIIFSRSPRGLVHYPEAIAAESYDVPEGTVRLAYGAFHGSHNLVSIALPASLTDIRGYVFNNVIHLEAIDVATGNTSFKADGGVLFTADGTELIAYPSCRPGNSYTIPAGVKTLRSASFFGCKQLENIDLGKVESLGSQAFTDCVSLRSVTLPATVDSIGARAFSGTSQLTEINVNTQRPPRLAADAFSARQLDTLQFNIMASHDEYASSDGWSGVKNLRAPDDFLEFSAREEGGYMVRTKRDVRLTGTVSLPAEFGGQKIVALADSAFYGSDMTVINIPATVKTIGLRAFHANSLLEAVNVDPKNVSFVSQDGVIYSRNPKGLAHYPQALPDEHYDVTEGTVRLAYGAFYGSRNLVSITLPASLTDIRGYVFTNANSLARIDVAEGNTAFKSDDGVLLSVAGELVSYPRMHPGATYRVPDDVKQLSDASFRGAHLESVDLPAGLTELGTQTFFNTEISHIIVRALTPPRTATSVFNAGQYENTCLWVPAEVAPQLRARSASSSPYQEHATWGRFKHIYAIPASISVNPAEATLTMASGSASQPTIRLTAVADDAEITPIWSSGNTEVATVDANGLVTAAGAGTTVIRAVSPENSEVYAEATVMVNPPVITSVEAVSAACSAARADVYDLGGVCLYTGVSVGDIAHKLSAGIYIIRYQDGRVAKMAAGR